MDLLTQTPPARKRFFPASVTLGATLLILSGCDARPAEESTPAARSPSVTYRMLRPEQVPLVENLSGRVVAYQTADIRPQISGIVTERLFREGDNVIRGQPLYRLDNRPYKAAVAQAEAGLEMARATAEVAVALEARYAPLVATQHISRQDYTAAVAGARQAKAAVAQAVAQLETARINLEFSTLTAPISGKIGRSFYTPGTLVTASQAEALATIQQLDPVYVDVQQTAAQLLSLKQKAHYGIQSGQPVPVKLRLENDLIYSREGTFEFSESLVDPLTGAVTLRARFPNPSSELLPGMFVEATLTRTSYEQAFLIPQSALMRNVRGEPAVYLIDKANMIVLKPVTTQGTWKQNWVVTAGLSAGDRLVTGGFIRIQEGDRVSPQPESPGVTVSTSSRKED